MNEQDKIKLILEIQRDPNLTDAEKAMKRQEVMTGKWIAQVVPEDENANGNISAEDAAFADTLKCAICFDLCSRPITAPCQHNFCLKCFQDLVSKSKKKACPSCRHDFGSKFAENPRINTALAVAIRAFKAGDRPATNSAFTRMDNDDRPDEAFTTDRAQRGGLANASSGKIFVTTPPDHFGPIPASADPRGIGVKVGQWWENRLHCRQWGSHLPHVAGIAGQSGVGAQSVVLSGGYEDDRDEGDWFLYTGSGGRDLEGNKRTNKEQSFDQEFVNMNLALKKSCIEGLPVRVVRSHKEKRSSYAPSTETPVRYDGVYRIAACWRKKGAQGLLMCRFLFMRCDNEPAPWSSDDAKDKPWSIKDLPKEAVKEMQKAKEAVVYMEDSPWWDWDAEKGEWGWARAPPESQRIAGGSKAVRARKKVSEQERALRELSCELCKNVMTQPMTAPCTHSFCKGCLDTHFGGQTFEYDSSEVTGRSMRVRKITITCPRKGCTADISDFLKRGQVNRDIEGVIAKLQRDVDAARAEASKQEGSETEEGDGNDAEEEPSGITQEVAAPEAVAASPSIVSLRRAPQTEAELTAAAAAELCVEFSEFDSELVQALVEQEDGDVQAVRICLTRMRNNEENEKKKRAKEARQAAAAVSPAAANGGKRGRGKSAAPSGSGANAKKNVGRVETAKRVKVAA